MGLDLLEFTMEVEEAFELRFADDDLPGITTPRRLIDYLVSLLHAPADPVCLSQRTFYRLRRAVAARLHCGARDLRPDTSLPEIIQADGRGVLWEEVRGELGLTTATAWPRLAATGWFDAFRRRRVSTLREATQMVVAQTPRRLKPPGKQWTRDEIAEVVHALICNRFGLRRDQYTEDSSWREDMGVD